MCEIDPKFRFSLSDGKCGMIFGVAGCKLTPQCTPFMKNSQSHACAILNLFFSERNPKFYEFVKKARKWSLP